MKAKVTMTTGKRLEIIESRIKSVELTLTGPQALTLKNILMAVGGTPETTPRKYANQIAKMLEVKEITSEYQIMINQGRFKHDGSISYK